MSEYIYFITENEDSNFFSTSFELIERNGERFFEIYNFDFKFNLNLLKYVSVDQTCDPYDNTFKWYEKYKNTNIKFYVTELFDKDEDRKTIKVRIIREEPNMDLTQYKRNIRIENLLE